LVVVARLSQVALEVRAPARGGDLARGSQLGQRHERPLLSTAEEDRQHAAANPTTIAAPMSQPIRREFAACGRTTRPPRRPDGSGCRWGRRDAAGSGAKAAA